MYLGTKNFFFFEWDKIIFIFLNLIFYKNNLINELIKYWNKIHFRLDFREIA